MRAAARACACDTTAAARCTRRAAGQRHSASQRVLLPQQCPARAHLLHVDGDVEKVQDVVDGACGVDQALRPHRAGRDRGSRGGASRQGALRQRLLGAARPAAGFAAASLCDSPLQQLLALPRPHRVHGAANHAAQRVPGAVVKPDGQRGAGGARVDVPARRQHGTSSTPQAAACCWLAPQPCRPCCHPPAGVPWASCPLPCPQPRARRLTSPTSCRSPPW